MPPKFVDPEPLKRQTKGKGRMHVKQACFPGLPIIIAHTDHAPAPRHAYTNTRDQSGTPTARVEPSAYELVDEFRKIQT